MLAATLVDLGAEYDAIAVDTVAQVCNTGDTSTRNVVKYTTVGEPLERVVDLLGSESRSKGQTLLLNGDIIAEQTAVRAQQGAEDGFVFWTGRGEGVELVACGEEINARSAVVLVAIVNVACTA